ncbi:hydroxyacid dehydrogenase [Actinoalloteichus caeruleus]|uniref:D-3-phosphoglycerate dehydrogenase n=1 Tax=Actinoalloteichus caeruleus DSM 43889 TaxID=1120930 RepID=A0ABT1JF88_ACTCY|nr:hydroxyacid dehydrogenase [Actinoalloteichus caeruleus]MCP2331162.1 D-3-phosphoglycerate dehydrogenase [Actinoalloteichus caeruleus DSM 43889]
MTGPSTPVVYVPRPVHPDALELLAGHGRVVPGYGADAVPFEQVADTVEAVLLRTAELRAPSIDRAPRLRVISRHGVGVDTVDVAAATARGIPVCVTPAANTLAVAEHAVALLLAASRLVALADRGVRRGDHDLRRSLIGTQLTGKRLGLVGFGRIGAEVARIARAGFRMEIVAHDPFLRDEEVRARGGSPVGLDELLSTSSAVSLHLPRTDRTAGLLGARELGLLRADAVLVNTARGGIVDEAALVDALRSGRLAGAGLDVVDTEPLPAGHPLTELDNVVLTPHVGGQTRESMRQVAMDAARAVVDVFEGRQPAHAVNPEVFSA